MKISKKRMVSLFLALVLTLSLAVPALAADALPTVPKGYSITHVDAEIMCEGSYFFLDGMWPVLKVLTRDKYGDLDTTAWAYLTTAGKVVDLDKKACGFEFSEGLAPFMDQTTKKVGYMDTTGKVVIPAQFEPAMFSPDEFAAGRFVNGNALVFHKTGTDEYSGDVGTWSQIDKNGKAVPKTLEETTGDGGNIYTPYNDTILKDVTCETLQIAGEKMENILFNEGYAVVNLLENHDCSNKEYDCAHYIIKKEGAAPAVPAAITAKPTATPVTLNGKPVALEAYNIENNNYFMLRDIASILSGTDKQFNVSYDKVKKAVVLTGKTAYTPVGGELAAGSGKTQSAVKSSSPILKDGVEIALTAYNIHGNNFFKLRDLGQAFDFGVDYDKATKSVCIDSAKGYTAEK